MSKNDSGHRRLHRRCSRRRRGRVLEKVRRVSARRSPPRGGHLLRDAGLSSWRAASSSISPAGSSIRALPRQRADSSPPSRTSWRRYERRNKGTVQFPAWRSRSGAADHAHRQASRQGGGRDQQGAPERRRRPARGLRSRSQGEALAPTASGRDKSADAATLILARSRCTERVQNPGECLMFRNFAWTALLALAAFATSTA